MTTRSWRTRSWRRALVLAAPGLALASCGRQSPSSLRPQGPVAEGIADAWWLMFSLATAVYLVVGGFIVLAALRGRRGEGEARPTKLSDNAFIVMGGVVVPVVILMILAVVTVRTTNAVKLPGGRPMRVEVRSSDWWWQVRYPGRRIVTANEIHIPVGRTIEVGLTTADVIHSFWVPQLAGKMDLVPGQHNKLRLRADRPGVYQGECAEFCGLQHANMRFVVVAETPGEFERWATNQALPTFPPTSDQTARGRLVFERESCAGCHTIRGTGARGILGPDLTHFGSRRTIGAGAVPNTRGNLAGWIADAQSIKPGNLMPPVTLEPDELLALVAYLEDER